MIDRKLNYGRHLIKRNLEKSQPFELVLDLGAGQGDDLLLSKQVNKQAQLLAVECYPAYAERLTDQQIEVYNVNIEKEKLPFADASIDVIICNQILEHCKELFWVFHEISRVLKKDGKLIIGVPNLASLHNRILLLIGEQPTSIQNNSAHVRGYTKKDMVKLLDSGFPNGYFLKEFGGSNFYPFPPVIAKPLAMLFPTLAWGIFFLFEKRLNYHKSFLEYPTKESLETNFFLG